MHPIIRYRHFLIGLLILSYIPAFSQLQTLKFITYNTNNGLLHNYTKKCVEDNKGFIWIVTEIGLSRFDGYNFTNYQHDDHDSTSLPHNSINDIAAQDNGRIWLATEKGLCFYDPAKAGFSSIDITGTFTHSPSVLAFCIDNKNNAIWFITDKALFELNLQTFQIKSTSCTNTTPTLINQVYLSSDNKVWIATYRDGFLLYDISHDATSSHFKQSWVTCFREGKNRTMWIGNWHSEHLVAYDMDSGNHKSYRLKDNLGKDKYMIISGITDSPFYGDSSILISTLTMGVRVFNYQLQKFVGGYSRDLFVKYSLPTDFTNYIYTDSRGIVWVCTWNGLCKMNMLEQQFRTVEIPVLNTPMFQYYNLVEGIVAADQPGTWWLGINGSGLIKYDPAKKQMVKELLADVTSEETSLDPGVWIEFLIKTKEGTIWAGNDEGIAKIEGDKIRQYDLRVDGVHLWKKNICIAPDQTFWISTSTHLIHFYPATGKYDTHALDPGLQEPLPDHTVSQAGFCNDGMLWTGTYKGLFRFNVKTNEIQRFPLTAQGIDSVDVNTINSLITDGNETIYLGTSGGFGIYNIRTGQFNLKGNEENVKPVLWKSLLQDKNGNVWIYTPHSLFKYDPVKDEFSKFTTADGIHNFSSDPTHLFDFEGNFYIGYRGAYTEFDPLKVDVNQTHVKPLITEMWIGNQQQKLNIDSFSTHSLSLPAGKKEITFHYTGIDYTNSDKITFLYKLNTDIEWHEAGTNRTVTYTNLPPGNYTFQLKARNSSGIVNDEGAMFNLSIAPTLLQRWWFWPTIATFFVLIVILLANKRVRKIREEEKRKTEANKLMAELETKLLRSQMNPHFIFNSLNSIQKYIWENKEEDAAEYLAQFAKLIRAILENSRKEFISLREELDVLKIYIELEHRRSNGKFDYHIRVGENLKPENLLVPPLLLQPYIENAIWHGVNKKTGHGHIDISIQQKKDLLEIIVDDDGVGRNFNNPDGISTSGQKTSMGTNITKQRIQHLQTKTSVADVNILDKTRDGIAAGTTVIVTIPVKYVDHA